MLPKYRLTIAALPYDVRAHLRSRFTLPGDASLYSGLHAAGLGQADVVMELLRLGTPAAHEGIALLVGRPVTVLPPAVPPRIPLPVRPRAKEPDDRVVLSVGRNPRLPTTPSFQRYRLIQAGLSVAQLLKRGVTRRDLRELTSGGHIQLEALA